MMLKKKSIALILLSIVCYGFVYAGANDILNEFDIEPNPMEKSTLISVAFTARVQVDIVIETEDRLIIKTLYSGNIEPGFYEFFWNRLSDTGEYVQDGQYDVTVRYRTRYTSTKKTLILK